MYHALRDIVVLQMKVFNTASKLKTKCSHHLLHSSTVS